MNKVLKKTFKFFSINEKLFKIKKKIKNEKWNLVKKISMIFLKIRRKRRNKNQIIREYKLIM